jgi:hypothetical protein
MKRDFVDYADGSRRWYGENHFVDRSPHNRDTYKYILYERGNEAHKSAVAIGSFHKLVEALAALDGL